MRRVSLIVSGPSSFSSARPRPRIPVPASSTIISPSARTSTQLVLPPYRIVVGPGTGSEPRTPHNFIRGGTEPSSSGEVVARGRCGIAIGGLKDFPICQGKQLSEAPTTLFIILNDQYAWHQHAADFIGPSFGA